MPYISDSNYCFPVVLYSVHAAHIDVVIGGGVCGL